MPEQNITNIEDFVFLLACYFYQTNHYKIGRNIGSSQKTPTSKKAHIRKRPSKKRPYVYIQADTPLEARKAFFWDDLVPSIKIIINYPRTYGQLPCKGEPYQFIG